MATVMSEQHQQTCKQCGYEFGATNSTGPHHEWNFDCRRCGYGESLDWIAAADATRIGWKHETLDGHGVVWATRPGNGVSVFHGLRSAQRWRRQPRKCGTASRRATWTLSRPTSHGGMQRRSVQRLWLAMA